jgi:DNA-binding HxlR family transcriptional regulator
MCGRDSLNLHPKNVLNGTRDCRAKAAEAGIGFKTAAAWRHLNGAAPGVRKALTHQLSGRKKPRMRPKTYRFNLQNKLSEERERRIPAPLNTMDASYTGRASRVVELLQGKWTVQVLCAMRIHPVRLSGLKRAIPSTSKKALTASLRSLEAARVVFRRDLSSSVLHVEYELAEAMREPVVALLDQLAKWGALYDSEERPTMHFSETEAE